MKFVLISLIALSFNISFAAEGSDIGTYMCIDEHIDVSIADVAFKKMNDGSILGQITSVGKLASAQIKSELKQVDCDTLESKFNWAGGCFQGDGITFLIKHLDQLGSYRAFNTRIVLPDGDTYICKVKGANTDLPDGWEGKLL